MTEINNNIQGYIKSNDINKIIPKEEIKPEEKNIEKENIEKIIKDPGTIGRSQINRTKSEDVSRSVDEAIFLVKKNPALMGCSESVFDSVYVNLINQGLAPNEAYMKALIAEEEFMAMAQSYNK